MKGNGKKGGGGGSLPAAAAENLTMGRQLVVIGKISLTLACIPLSLPTCPSQGHLLCPGGLRPFLCSPWEQEGSEGRRRGEAGGVCTG